MDDLYLTTAPRDAARILSRIMPDQTETTEFSLDCPSCGAKAVALVGPADPASKPIQWTCPACQKLQTANFGGRLLWVVRQNQRDEPEP